MVHPKTTASIKQWQLAYLIYVLINLIDYSHVFGPELNQSKLVFYLISILLSVFAIRISPLRESSGVHKHFNIVRTEKNN